MLLDVYTLTHYITNTSDIQESNNNSLDKFISFGLRCTKTYHSLS